MQILRLYRSLAVSDSDLDPEKREASPLLLAARECVHVTGMRGKSVHRGPHCRGRIRVRAAGGHGHAAGDLGVREATSGEIFRAISMSEQTDHAIRQLDLKRVSRRATRSAWRGSPASPAELRGVGTAGHGASEGYDATKAGRGFDPASR